MSKKKMSFRRINKESSRENRDSQTYNNLARRVEQSNDSLLVNQPILGESSRQGSKMVKTEVP